MRVAGAGNSSILRLSSEYLGEKEYRIAGKAERDIEEGLEMSAAVLEVGSRETRGTDGCCTDDALLRFWERVLGPAAEEPSKPLRCAVVSLDARKAYDTISHATIIKALVRRQCPDAYVDPELVHVELSPVGS